MQSLQSDLTLIHVTFGMSMLVVECCLFFFGSGDDNAIPQNDMIGPLNYAAFSINSCIFFFFKIWIILYTFSQLLPLFVLGFCCCFQCGVGFLEKIHQIKVSLVVILRLFFFFYQIKKKRLRALNTYLFQWNVFTNTFSRFFQKIEIKRTMRKSDNVCDVNFFYLIPRVNFCLSINYSDATSMKRRLPSSFSFFIFKKLLKMENAVEMPKYSPALNLFQPVRTRTLLS